MALSACLLVFTKPARPGMVKTRLIGELTPEQAADLHEAFLSDLLARLEGAPFETRIAWALDEGDPFPPSPLPGVRQEGEDLGERLYRALAQASGRHQLVAAVGSDHPELEPETVAEAFRELGGGADVVLGPADDGGYYLVGLRREALHPRLFEEIPWSTSAVLARTRDRIAELGLSARFLESGHDVDTVEDLERLARRIARGELPDLPSTESLLRRWDRLPQEAPA